MNIIRNIPNSVTCLNLLAGMMSIVCSAYADKPLWGLCGWQWGAIFIAVGALADFLDGFFARLLRAYSELGKELDSLCDLVSFGVAPAFILFHILPSAEALPWLKWCVFLIPVAAALRLARFNIDTRQTTFFIGLPVPANAIFWIGFAAMVAGGNAPFLLNPVVFLALLVFESWLMLSSFKLFSLKFSNYSFSPNRWRYLLVAAAVVLVFCMGWSGLMWLIIFYFLLSLCVGVK